MEEDARKIEGLAESVRRRLPDDETMAEVAELFKMFGDPTRAKILGCLQIRELNVGEIADVLNMSVSAVSHQLRVLRAAKLVKGVNSSPFSSILFPPVTLFYERRDVRRCRSRSFRMMARSTIFARSGR